MPFEIPQQESEVITRKELGRRALSAMAARLEVYAGPFNVDRYCQCAYGVCRDLPEVLATGLQQSGGVPMFESFGSDLAITAAFGLPGRAWSRFIYGFKDGEKAPDVARRIRKYLAA